MDFELYIIGSNSAVSMHGRNPTAQALQLKNNWFLIDCGEGTQMRMLQFHVKAFRIDNIFISHLHGDHYFGLIGLLTSYHLLKRKAPLTIFAPKPLANIVEVQLEASQTFLGYELNFVDTQSDHVRRIYENESVEVFSFPLNHKIPTTGFLFREKPGEKKLNIQALQDIELEKKYYKLLKQGYDVEDKSGHKIKSEDVTLPHKKMRSYAFCSDTLYDERILEIIKEVDLLYHEATFLHAEHNRAEETKHSTAKEAALMAQKANAKKLLIGHFSSRYVELEPLLEEAKNIFPNTELAIEGEVFSI